MGLPKLVRDDVFGDLLGTLMLFLVRSGLNVLQVIIVLELEEACRKVLHLHRQVIANITAHQPIFLENNSTHLVWHNTYMLL